MLERKKYSSFENFKKDKEAYNRVASFCKSMTYKDKLLYIRSIIIFLVENNYNFDFMLMDIDNFNYIWVIYLYYYRLGLGERNLVFAPDNLNEL